MIYSEKEIAYLKHLAKTTQLSLTDMSLVAARRFKRTPKAVLHKLISLSSTGELYR